MPIDPDITMALVPEEELCALRSSIKRAQDLQRGAEDQANNFLQEAMSAQSDYLELENAIKNDYVFRLNYESARNVARVLREQNVLLKQELNYLKSPWWKRLFLPKPKSPETVENMVLRKRSEYQEL